jgi:hypothetical protein
MENKYAQGIQLGGLGALVAATTAEPSTLTAEVATYAGYSLGTVTPFLSTYFTLATYDAMMIADKKIQGTPKDTLEEKISVSDARYCLRKGYEAQLRNRGLHDLIRSPER